MVSASVVRRERDYLYSWQVVLSLRESFWEEITRYTLTPDLEAADSTAQAWRPVSLSRPEVSIMKRPGGREVREDREGRDTGPSQSEELSSVSPGFVLRDLLLLEVLC